MDVLLNIGFQLGGDIDLWLQSFFHLCFSLAVTGIGHGSLGERRSKPGELCVCWSDPNQGPASWFPAETRAQCTSSGMNTCTRPIENSQMQCAHYYVYSYYTPRGKVSGKKVIIIKGLSKAVEVSIGICNKNQQSSQSPTLLLWCASHRFCCILLLSVCLCCLLMRLKSGEQVTHSSWTHNSINPNIPPSLFCGSLYVW